MINLSIAPGEFFFILGPSGCGKSTLLKMIAGLISPDSGSISFEGSSIDDKAAYQRPFNTVFQNYSLFPHLTVAENIGFGLRMAKTPKKLAYGKIMEILKEFQIEDLASRKPSQISGGQQQRVALARAIINQPKVLLLDEPLSALDEKLRLEMQQILKDLRKKLQTTFVYVTHSQDEALSMGDRVAVMREGEIQQIDTPQRIYHDPETKFIAEFVGEVNFLESEPYGTSNGVPIIRPENISISKNQTYQKGDNIEDVGVILERLFKGNTITYLAQTQNYGELKVTIFNTASEAEIMVNEKVYLHWSKQNIKYVRLS